MIEIERKYLVKPNAIDTYDHKYTIEQGYLVKNDKGSVRIRIETALNTDPKELLKVNPITQASIAILTTKTKIGQDLMSNYETNDQITVENARLILDNHAVKIIKKTRYVKYFWGKKWEIDQFHQPNNGLLLAEIELNSVDEEIDLPEWIDREVTGESQYYNANM
jgi:adenylate cyclase